MQELVGDHGGKGSQNKAKILEGRLLFHRKWKVATKQQSLLDCGGYCIHRLKAADSWEDKAKEKKERGKNGKEKSASDPSKSLTRGGSGGGGGESYKEETCQKSTPKICKSSTGNSLFCCTITKIKSETSYIGFDHFCFSPGGPVAGFVRPSFPPPRPFRFRVVAFPFLVVLWKRAFDSRGAISTG